MIVLPNNDTVIAITPAQMDTLNQLWLYTGEQKTIVDSLITDLVKAQSAFPMFNTIQEELKTELAIKDYSIYERDILIAQQQKIIKKLKHKQTWSHILEGVIGTALLTVLILK